MGGEEDIVRKSTSISPERIRKLRDGSPPEGGGRYVLYWMQSAQRAEENPALEFAVQRANSLGLPLVVCFVLTPDFPEASLRHYTFMVEGLLETFQALRRRGAFTALRFGAPPVEAAKLAQDAAEVVLDQGYLRTVRQWYKRFQQSVKCTVWQVEGEAVVPVRLASTKAEYAARTIRPRIKSHLDDFLFRLLPTDLVHKTDSIHGLELTELEGVGVSDVLGDLTIDREVGPVSRFFQGGTSSGKALYQDFLDSWLPDYDVQRNQPQTDYTSTMSPYLHYGMISPLYLITQMLSQCQGNDPNVESYLEELIIRRGLSQNFCEFEERYDSYQCLPDWARKTLADHADDPRPDYTSPARLEAAESHDPYWNACQVEMVETGYMHNYMRMYWGKKILEWSESPEIAYKTTITLNNKYFLDGRDPISFANVLWIYGLHDRAWQERPIYGKIRTMTAGGLERKNDPKAYVDKVEERTGRAVSGKDWLC